LSASFSSAKWKESHFFPVLLQVKTMPVEADPVGKPAARALHIV